MGFVVVGASKNESSSSSIVPHASNTVSSSGSCSPRLGDCALTSKALFEIGLRNAFSLESLIAGEACRGGTEFGRSVVFGWTVVLFVGACISPFAVEILLVNEEIAHPAHELSFCVPIRADAALLRAPTSLPLRLLSPRVAPYFRIRCR